MNALKREHLCRMQNLGNLFPHNMLAMFKYMFLIIYLGLCCLAALNACSSEAKNIKCVENGSQGSTLHSLSIITLGSS